MSYSNKPTAIRLRVTESRITVIPIPSPDTHQMAPHTLQRRDIAAITTDTSGIIEELTAEAYAAAETLFRMYKSGEAYEGATSTTNVILTMSRDTSEPTNTAPGVSSEETEDEATEGESSSTEASQPTVVPVPLAFPPATRHWWKRADAAQGRPEDLFWSTRAGTYLSRSEVTLGDAYFIYHAHFDLQEVRKSIPQIAQVPRSWRTSSEAQRLRWQRQVERYLTDGPQDTKQKRIGTREAYYWFRTGVMVEPSEEEGE
ncbi:hypothetical protein EJ04DRAFT_592654 [Polyplosphaeria fusca]|uniref:Uncharacterized protein n=1 Tax=Polyplosphaeria fusca TaxID=682080 RepID=A0A9P4RBI6_9PLEO|nr:hypothetical protein EJ04DRAFT_592654 [Polyplosphaeria fusca]